MLCETRALKKSFGEHFVLTDITLSLRSGVRYALTGPSGCGKTTLLRLLCQLDQPDSGQILCPSHARFSYAFQEPRLFAHLTVAENIRLLTPTRPMEPLLRELDLTDAAGQYPHALSGGMKKRAALARALAVEADIYLIDEPTAGQDAAHAAWVCDAILRYTKDALCVCASHDEPFLARFTQSRIRLHDGIATIE